MWPDLPPVFLQASKKGPPYEIHGIPMFTTTLMEYSIFMEFLYLIGE